MNELTNQDLINEELCYEVRLLEEPQDILFNLIKCFKERAAIVTSGQLSGMILLHMAYENNCHLELVRLTPSAYSPKLINSLSALRHITTFALRELRRRRKQSIEWWQIMGVPVL